ncbi:MAG: hypothetical protein OEY67_09300, partial [Gammaproteobacteria bacterium]|nr:hypothetical protein [Gammaproteobacteria bacterium]
MEVYRLILKTCAVETGIVIDADQSILGLITTSGQYHVLERDQISTILVYNTVNNPFREIQQGNETRRALLDVYVEDTSKPLFTGWAVRFVDDLAFFYGIDGKSYNIDIHKITMVDQAHSDTSTLSPANGNETLAFDYGRDFPECGLTTGGSAAAGSIAPVQILSDQIKIEKWFLNLQRGFTRLQQFRERTLFYAKPMIYREDSRFGVFQLINGSKGKGKYGMEPPVSIPAYLFRSGGKPFLYQHQTTFGSKISDLAPTVEPVTAFTSDIKAHLFHGSFVLNLNNPAPGEGVIKALAESQLDYFREVASQKTDVLTTFHYLALSGVDYRRFSFSGGYFFPVFGIQT